MDAVKFLQERQRMYESGAPTPSIRVDGDYDLESAVKIVEEWAAAHPPKTRQSVFLSHYPNAEVDEDGVLKVCPKVVEGPNYMDSHRCGLVPCAVCHKAYWSVAVKEGNTNNA